MDDNATCHRTLAVQDCLDSEGIQRLVWPARSPDLNPIENVWDALGRQVAGRNYPPTNKNTLIRALTEEWDKLPLQLLDNVLKNSKHFVAVLSASCLGRRKGTPSNISTTHVLFIYGVTLNAPFNKASNGRENVSKKNGDGVLQKLSKCYVLPLKTFDGASCCKLEG
ncbi:hypothetical protein TNCV_4655271 [Trichonephila clavipes]|nr:hypothetical protein TNCV_4655271 [Trichonephila clavipes]